MNIGDRIRIRREALGLSQLELAHRLGYGSKSTVCKVENGVHDLTQTNVVKYAKALDTTPAYLMGWETDVVVGNINEDLGKLVVMMRHEPNLRELVEQFSRLNRYQQENLLRFVRSMQPDEHHELPRTDSQGCN